MAESFHRSFFLEGPVGRLEAMLWTSSVRSPARAGLVCHPHPLYGGTMHNKVVFHVARALHGRGFPVLRFNFRGTGLSAGKHDAGRGETEDVRAALDYLSDSFPRIPVILAGFSFGAAVGLGVGCEDARVAELIGLGLPANPAHVSYLTSCTKPKLFLHGEIDQNAAVGQVEALFDKMPPPKQLDVILGADHFFYGHLDQMTAALNKWLDGYFGPQRSRGE